MIREHLYDKRTLVWEENEEKWKKFDEKIEKFGWSLEKADELVKTMLIKDKTKRFIFQRKNTWVT